MNTNKPNSLENFVERHRADFDTHEPRPDLWAALEQQLNEPVAAPTLRLATEPAAIPAVAPRANWLQRYGVAASLALLVFAAGASEAWKSHSPAAEVAAVPAQAGTSNATAEADAALYQGGNPLAMAAAERTTGADSQLVRAVWGMEAYYTNQLARRQQELSELKGPGMASVTADWQLELVSLDSSYRQLKAELLNHPQPDAVLTAMNRNLQVRLDILDQQLHLGAGALAEERNTSSYVLADSRRQAE
ncbi:hypothetical protein ACFST9_21060 [Hymenobacter monticola]|uniref:Anti-sigma factor n=1 Tax=Hymenobacter monticola TaxID=1705399 RepID=A0ABY4B7Z0_9BACT|nr:hypothetical protein [Hymenobacter monticola]UOE34412.1 hypothetical protein MTP16_01850 [Hymenobacter monticola]